jgi:hypothetical protein
MTSGLTDITEFPDGVYRYLTHHVSGAQITNIQGINKARTLTAAEENALRRLERKVLRKIYGPVVDKGVWRIRHNNELCELMGGEDIVTFIKSQRIQWLDHVERMDETAMPKRVLYATRKIGRPRIRWLEDVIADQEEWELVDGWRRQEIGISGGGSLMRPRPRPTQGCSADKKKKMTFRGQSRRHSFEFTK